MTAAAPVIAAILRPEQDPAVTVPAARAAEEDGLVELWIWEDAFRGGAAAVTGAILGATSRLRVGIGVMPFPLRNVGLAAMELSALERMAPGRVLPGFGHGVQEWMRQAGVKPRSVLGLEREYVEALRGLLAGEEVTVAGDYVTLDRVQLTFPPAAPPAIHLAATGPKSLELSGAVGDGTILTDDATSLDDWPRIRDLVLGGRADAGRDGEHEFTLFLAPPSRDAGETAALVRAWTEAGIHRVALQPDEDEADPAGFLGWVAREVVPRAS